MAKDAKKLSAKRVKAMGKGTRGRTNIIGRPEHEPSKESRTLVSVLAAIGANQDAIARELGISDVTMRKYYSEELANGAERILNTIGAGLVNRALRGDNACAFFFLKTRGGPGWKQQYEHAHGGIGGGPIDVRLLSTDQILAGIAALNAAEDEGGAGS